MIEEELKTEIYKLINFLINNNIISYTVAETEKERKAFTFLKANGFFENSTSKNQYKPSSLAYKLYELKAEKYFKKLRESEIVEGKIKRKTLFDLNNKYFINFGFLVLGYLFSWFITNISESDASEQTTEKLSKVISEKTDSIIQIQTHLNEQNIIILSLKNEIDSLKIQKPK
jgi:hypothetical protein